ncbi:MAG: aminotransferase class V-fold PLP-dependent enzyme [Microthrixaceae bacterium]
MADAGTNGDILLTACGAAAPAPGVVDRMNRHLQREVEVGGYDAQDEVADELASARDRVGALLGLEPGDVSLTDSGTSATVSLFQAMVAGGWGRAGGLIVCDPREFGSNLNLLRRLAAASGVRLRLLDLTEEGHPDTGQLGTLVASGRVDLVWLSLAHAHAGWTNPVADVTAVLRERPEHTWLVLDACQSFGQLNESPTPLDPDGVIGTSRKWVRGPRGVGFAWVHPRRLEWLDPWPEASDSPLGTLERHENPVAVQLGLGVALAHLEKVGVAETHRAVAKRAKWLRGELGAMSTWRNIDDPHTASAMVSFAPAGPIGTHEAAVADAKAALAGRGVRLTATHRHHAPMGMEVLGAGAALRLGPHADQPWEELHRAAEMMAQVLT